MTERLYCHEQLGPGVWCTLEYGHQPADRHSTEVDLPPAIGELIQQHMDHLETATARYDKAFRSTRRAFWTFAVCCAIYFPLIIWRILQQTGVLPG